MTPLHKRTLSQHLAVVLLLAIAGVALFYQVLDTGFWSPEDLHELSRAARASAEGRLNQVWHPSVSGGYPVNPVIAFEFLSFGLNARVYYTVNLAVHVLNAYLAFLLVTSLLHRRRDALIAALLFVLAVGSYGKNVMHAAGISSLLYATMCLTATLLYVHNEKRNAGRWWGIWALGFWTLFGVSLFMRGATVSVVASCALYNVFFASERKRPILHTNLIVSIALTLVVLVGGVFLGRHDVTPSGAEAGAFLRNLPGYLILMVFPLQQSELLEQASPLVRALYAAAPVLRLLVGLTIVSYSLFGFIFGGRAIRFYIAWMYVMVMPFAFLSYPTHWLNIRFLYLVSLGFCVLLTTGAMYGYKLLIHRPERRLLPFLIPLFYVGVSVFLVNQLNRKNADLAQDPATRKSLAATAQLSVEGQ